MQFTLLKKKNANPLDGPKRFPVLHLVAAGTVAGIVGVTALLPDDSPPDGVAASATSTSALPVTSAQLPLTKTDPIAALAQKIEIPATQAIEQQKQLEDANWIKLKVGKGDTISGMFQKAGLPARTAIAVANAAKAREGGKAFNRIYPGESLQFLIEDNKLAKARHIHNRLKSTEITRTDGGYQLEKLERKPDIELRYAEAVINNSMFLAGARAGLSNRTIMSMASIFGWDIDFAMDIKKGDRFNVLYEEKYLDGEKMGVGEIVAAEFTSRGKTFTALRYTDQDGSTSYYTPDGRSMRKAFLRTPVDFARISSRFNLKRKHPVLNRIRAHKGVDYAAATGTPIKAAGDGKIIFRGRKGGYGKVVILQHGNGIRTLYAHMNNFRRNQKKGGKVKQGQVIGYIGTTGMSTGPHLHYEFQVNGVHRNPLKVKLPDAAPIAKAERKRFAEFASIVLTQLRGQNGVQLAQVDKKTETLTQ